MTNVALFKYFESFYLHQNLQEVGAVDIGMGDGGCVHDSRAQMLKSQVLFSSEDVHELRLFEKAADGTGDGPDDFIGAQGRSR